MFSYSFAEVNVGEVKLVDVLADDALIAVEGVGIVES